MSINIESAFSFKGSLIKEGSFKNVKELKYNALGLVDDNSSFYLYFYNECIKEGIKPIIGLRNKGSYFDYIIYPKNYNAYKKMLYFASNKTKDTIISLDDLIKDKGFIYVIEATYAQIESIDLIVDEFNELKSLGLNAYVGVDFNYYPCEASLYPMIKDKVDSVLFNKVKYISESDKEASLVLEKILKVNTSKRFDDSNLLDMESLTSFHLRDARELYKTYENNKELLNNYKALVDSINLKIEKENLYPLYKTNNGLSSEEFLKTLSEKGLSRRLYGTKKDKKKYKERLDYELNIIHQMGFDDYFLVVYDYILYAKKNNIYVGPGRGSSASSLVSYTLGIVDVDPLEYGLIFERFLNPDRQTMPDIDTDFEDRRRNDVINYCIEKYGENNVCLMNTYQTLQAKSALSDVALVLEIDSYKVDAIASEITKSNSFKDLLDNPRIITYMESDEDFYRLINIASKLENIPKAISIHPSGVIISPVDLRNYTELHMGSARINQSSFDEHNLEQLGFVKMDFLSLSYLSLLHDAVDLIKKTRNVDINLRQIPLDDEVCYKVLRNDLFGGVFQMDAPEMRNQLLPKKMHLDKFSDIPLALSLIRPGTKEQIPVYIDRKMGKKKIDYYDESIKDILTESLGTIVYQEQTLLIANKYSGLSLADADIMRRAISKKDPKLLSTFEPKFFSGAEKLGRKKEVTERLYNDIKKFSDYAYNKAHAVSYSMIAYYLLYLKTNYRSEFMATLFNRSNDFKYIKVLKKLKLSLLPPDLRHSSIYYSPYKNSIFMPITKIKGIGDEMASIILDVIKSSNYDYVEFVRRSRDNVIPRQVIESLILSGAFDYTKFNKKELIESLDKLYDFDVQMIRKDSELIKRQTEYPFSFLKENEHQLLGINLKYHPLKGYIGKLKRLSDLENKDGSLKIVALISSLQEIKSKSGVMARLVIEDEYQSVNAVIFNKDYMRCQHYIKNNTVYQLTGSLNTDQNGNTQFVIRFVDEILEDEFI